MAEMLNTQALPKFKAALPVPPELDLAAMTIRELWLLQTFFDGLQQAALLHVNQPRFDHVSAGKAGNFADGFWEFTNALYDAVIDELEIRIPTTQQDAQLRASALLAQMVQGEDFESIAALAGQIAGQRSHG